MPLRDFSLPETVSNIVGGNGVTISNQLNSEESGASCLTYTTAHRSGIAEYILDKDIKVSTAHPTTVSQPSSQRKTPCINNPAAPWYCVSRPINEQTKDIKIRTINRSRAINTSRLLEQCRSMLEFCTVTEKHEEFNETNIDELNYNHHWGDSLPTNTKGNSIRVVYQNVHRNIGATDSPETNALLENMEADVFLASETNCNWKTAAFRNNLQRAVKRVFPNHRVAYSLSDVGIELEFHEFLPGRTCTMAFDHIGIRVVKAGEDESGLGRWSYITVAGQDGQRLTFITAYRICKGAMKGTNTSCIQQRRVLNEQERKNQLPVSTPDTTYLRKKIVEDLTRFIQSLQAEGHAIVLGLDANETPSEALQNHTVRPGSISMLSKKLGYKKCFYLGTKLPWILLLLLRVGLLITSHSME